ncbi:hypothetical protein AUJ68_01200 [Candidatus Woesearchaeota archaeon CG1_02_57_44]|nr:MAG: hypothetical protein AUJ68_01200 [Candidatus Woesearchaeota archaeon CG1_02_57_44]
MILDSVFQPLFLLPAWQAILIVALLLTLGLTLAYKHLTDQKLMKQLREDIKKYQVEARAQRSNPEEMMRINAKAMEVNMQYMRHSMRPTLFTMIPIIILIGYLHAHLVYEPLQPDVPFDVTLHFLPGAQGSVTLDVPHGMESLSGSVLPIIADKTVYTMQGDPGTYQLAFTYGSRAYTKNIIITTQRFYEPPVQTYEGDLKDITVQMEYLHPFGDLGIFGWHPGWLGVYIIFSIIFSTLLRKGLGLH